LIAYIVDDIGDVLTQRGLRLTVDSFDDLPLIEGDVHQLYTAFTNIVGNAIKYTPDGGAIALSAARSAKLSTSPSPIPASAFPRGSRDADL
jgi:signal transduction histidine kinase